jgi:hypothetical protein
MHDRIAAWLASSCADADKRGLPELKPLLETLARSTEALREAERRKSGHGDDTGEKRPS